MLWGAGLGRPAHKVVGRGVVVREVDELLGLVGLAEEELESADDVLLRGGEGGQLVEGREGLHRGAGRGVADDAVVGVGCHGRHDGHC